VTAQLHGEAAAAAASAEFVRRFREGGIPAEIAEQTLPAGEHALAWVIAQALGVSSTEARRLIEGGGIKLDGEPVADPHARLALVAGGVPRLIQAGKRRFARVRAD
jgi:tyrosyl-tRNA synthetase